MPNKVQVVRQEAKDLNEQIATAQTIGVRTRGQISDVQLAVPTRPTSITAQSIPSFGQNGSGNTNPSDNVLLDVYSFTGVYLDSNYNVSDYNKLDADTLQFNVTKDLEDLGYINGKFIVQYRLLRNLLGAGDGEKLSIVEISSDRLEARVIPFRNSTRDSIKLKDYFQRGFLARPKDTTLPTLRLFLNSLSSYTVFDYIQDKVTTPLEPFSLILKFSNPLPLSVAVGAKSFLAQEITTSLPEEVVVLPSESQQPVRFLQGPNFDATNRYQSHVSTVFKNYNQLSGSANFETDLIAATLSGSHIESIPLNIDYRLFENFIHFGSITERLTNFQYKVRLLEGHRSRLAQLTTDLTGLPDSSITGSELFLNNIASTQNKINALVGGLDGYERYLYYGSSSYESSSYGEFYPTTWPKQNSTKPYALYSYSSSQAEDWFEGITASASLYDTANQYSLYKTIPEHIQEDPANDGYVLFIGMIGHYFDLIYSYIKQIVYVHNRQESVSEGFAKDIIYNIGESLGIDFDSGTKLKDLWDYTLGVNSSGSYIHTGEISLKDKQQELWKRLINNLPYLLKTKGTERGLRALVNIFGLPTTMLRIREYGGPEATWDSVSDYTYDRFFYALNLGMPSASATNYAKATVHWDTLDQTSTVPQAIELRFKIASGSTANQTIFENTGSFAVRTVYTNAATQSIKLELTGSAGTLSASIDALVYDDKFWSLLVNKQGPVPFGPNYSSSYTIAVQQVNYNKITQAYSASLLLSASISASYDNLYTGSNTLYLGGSGSTVYFTGSIQELRYWTTPLSSSAYNQHTLSPTSYIGNATSTEQLYTSSFYTLGARFCFGSDNKRYDLYATSSLPSQHPNQDTNSDITASFYNYISGSNVSKSYSPIAESHTLYWPDLSGNRQVSNKIRFQDNTLIKPLLDRNVKLEVSSNEVYPIDSPKLGLYFSPQDDVNQDIAEQFGGTNIDNLIGSPADLAKDNYASLNLLQYEYVKKYKGRSRIGDYLNRIKQVDDTVFRIAKQLVPLRANFQTGVVIEPTLLQRSKLPMQQPDWENNTYTCSIDIGADYLNITTGIEDVVGDDSTQTDYAFDVTISTPVTTLTASFDQITGSIDTDIVQIAMYANEYNDEQTYTALVDGTFPDGIIDLLAQEPSQYTYIETIYSGSVWTSSLNPSWRRDPLQPVVMDARLSEIFRTSEFTYLLNVPTFAGYGNLTGIGLSLDMTFTNFELNPAEDAIWTNAFLTGNGSASLSHSMSDTISVHGATNKFNVVYTYLKSNSVSQTISASFYSSGSLVYSNAHTDTTSGTKIVEFTTPLVTADQFELRVANNTAFATQFTLNDIFINIGSQPARVQDYNYLYEGKVRQLYKGTQQTSQDYNIDSDDTTDKGPVISVQTVNPNTLHQSNNRKLGNNNLSVD